MNLRLFSVCLLLACLALVAPTHGFESTRAELFREWSERLDRASAAMQRGEKDAAVGEYEAILGEAAARAEEGILVARAEDGLGDVLRERHDFAGATPHYERSAESFKRLLGESQPRLAVTLHHLGLCYVETGRWTEAETVLRETLRIWRASGAADGRVRETEEILDAALERRTIPWDAAISPRR